LGIVGDGLKVSPAPSIIRWVWPWTPGPYFCSRELRGMPSSGYSG
jgi:hypothetical protein